MIKEFGQTKLQLSAGIEEARRCFDEERRGRCHVLGQVRSLEQELCEVRGQLEEEMDMRADAESKLGKVNGECQSWRAKYESESLAK